MRHSRIWAALTLIGVLAFGARISGYVFWSGAKWPAPSIVMQLQLGSSSTPFTVQCQGQSRDWGPCAEEALALWNAYLSEIEFRVVRDSTVPKADHDGFNSVYFSDNVFGTPFNSGTLATTIEWRSGSRITDADVVFNQAVSWDRYQGPLRTKQDFRRVAAHEFGHVLGLAHPDQAGQTVVALMNSRVSNLETPQDDDVAGIRALYGIPAPPAPTPPPAPPLIVDFPPRDQSFAFRNTLEAKYRDGLGRQPVSSYADIEGSVVWTQEYLRYRVNLCSAADAASRVFMQIDGQGVQPVCGIPTGTQVLFPPRNETYGFRVQLEDKYRDGLRRGAGSTYVDIEGDVVWIQEYLRYRVNQCSHQQAVDRVLLQIDGQAVQPVCF